MTTFDERRGALRTFGLAAGLAALGGTAARAEEGAGGSAGLKALTERLAAIPRRRDFKTVPMILDDEAQWDQKAIAELIAYRARPPRQIWNNRKIEGPWLALMRNSLNTQVTSFRHPDFLVVSATHGTAHLALYDEATWDKYQLTRLAGDTFKTNKLLAEKRTTDAGDRDGVSPRDFSIMALMRRGVVFMGCHNAIWEQAGKLIKDGINPDKLAQDALAAELTNHLIEGVVLTPGIVATIPELQQAGFHYIG